MPARTLIVQTRQLVSPDRLLVASARQALLQPRVNAYTDYLLYDLFSTDRAAGAVNATLAEPGGTGTVAQRTRTVVDTNSKLSIAGSAASFATGGTTRGNPGLWWGSHVRAAGRLVTGSVSPTSGGWILGWDTNQSSQGADGLSGSTGLVLSVRDSGGNLITVGTVANATTYSPAVVMRGVGAYFFIKGGAFTNWTFLWASDTGSAALFPQVAAETASSIFTADNVRIPTSTWLPTPLAYDTFTRTDGALGSSETTGPDSQTVTARAWTDQLGTWAIATNKAVATALSGGLALATVPAVSADVLHDVAVTRAAGVAGMVLRYTDASNYLIVYLDGTSAKCDQVVAGVTTGLRNTAVTYVAGATLRVILSGTTGRMFYNGAAAGASFTVPASSATAHGLYTTDTSNSLDAMQTFAVGTGGEYSGLDAL